MKINKACFFLQYNYNENIWKTPRNSSFSLCLSTAVQRWTINILSSIEWQTGTQQHLSTVPRIKKVFALVSKRSSQNHFSFFEIMIGLCWWSWVQKRFDVVSICRYSRQQSSLCLCSRTTSYFLLFRVIKWVEGDLAHRKLLRFLFSYKIKKKTLWKVLKVYFVCLHLNDRVLEVNCKTLALLLVCFN